MEEWIHLGDRNTKFYHATTIIKNKRKKITWLKTENEEQLTENTLLEGMAQEYFQNLFKEEYTSNIVLPTHNGFLEILGEQQQLLQTPFYKEEVKTLLFDMAPFKAPRNDGLHAGFYQKAWNIVGDSLCEFVLNFLETGLLPEEANDTLMVLIPKVKHPYMISQFRPISLCNVGYKVITKTLTNRLKEIMPYITAPHKSSFVPGHQINNNIVIY